MINNIKNFFKNDTLNFREYPVEEIKNYFLSPYKKYYLFDLSIINSEKTKQELKDFLFCIFMYDNPYNFKSDNLNYLFNFPNYIKEYQVNSILDINVKAETKNLLLFYNSISKKSRHVLDSMLGVLKFTLLEYYDTRKGLDRNFWTKEILKINEERFNKAGSQYTLNFWRYENENNRELVKKWFVYLLGCTELAFSTLINYNTNMYLFCDYLKDTFLKDVDRNVIKEYLNINQDKSNNKINKIVITLSEFYKYLSVHKEFDKEIPIVMKHDKKPDPKKMFHNTVSEYVILKIFNHLHELPFHLMVMYLINYCTGMRISDICQLKNSDCIFTMDNCYFIRYSVQKMQKEHAVLIPKALYDLIAQQINVNKALSYKEIYLFPSLMQQNRPFQTQNYGKNMKKWCLKWNIRNEDGTPYDFKSHSYRHTIATDLLKNYNVKLEVIQLAVLGHSNINMTTCYAERDDEYRAMLNDKYIGRYGNLNPLISDADKEALFTAEWVRDNLEKQLLPNGICGYPFSLGTCPNYNSCIDCDYFKTSAKYLNIHKSHLAAIESKIPIYEANQWLPNLKTAIEQRNTLKLIINKLEDMKKGDE